MRFLIIIAALTVAHVLGDKCLDCICQQESQCKPIHCHMDVGSLSCGYFQIKKPYYIDCGEPGKRPGESVEAAWKRCADDYNCALSCKNKYFERYRHNCAGTGMGECEQRARIHNGGPNGCRNQGTNVYWNSVKKCCNCS